MHNNEFEKKVELRLEELSFSPSHVVWDKVELQLKQQKRRRRFFFWWLPLAVLCTGTAGWFAYTVYTSNSKPENKAVAYEQLQNTENKTSTQPVTAVTNEKQASDADNSIPENKAVPDNKKTAEETFKKPEQQPAVRQKETIAVFKPVGKHKKETIVKTKEEKLPASDIAETTNDETVKTTVQESKKDDQLISQDSSAQSAIVNVEEQQQQKQADSSISVQTENPVKKKRVEWYARLGAGASTMSQFSTDVFSPFAADRSNSGTQASPGTGSSIGSGPSAIKPGVGFSAGVQLRTIAKKRSSFSAGLNYGFYSTSIKTGSMVYSNTQFNVSNYNSVVSNYMRSGDSSMFQNRYHFIELPVLYHLQLTKPQKRPFVLNTGLSYNYLIASNANYYSGQPGAYYYDRNLFNRSQLRFHIGLSSSFIKKEKYPLQVGLHYQFGLSGQWKQPLTLNQQLSYTGIEVLWRLHK
ncbi:MAG: outer membrane beta-barrel protein [Lacibacter sp.]